MAENSNVADGMVVTVHYTLTVDGNLVESSRDGKPFEYLHGASNIVPGLESALTGKTVGETLDVTVQPDLGYGEREDDATQVVSRSAFPDEFTPQVGIQFFAETEDGEAIPAFITGVDGDDITVDFNHPLAGQVLDFSVEILDMRPASETELEHGHPHGAGGCGHDHD
ncbi:MAG: peptidylprolyl isomerase [Planctomycetes bacterium]|nr:peptidylprolyl isomerase [Planctomycetota bacterium]